MKSILASASWDKTVRLWDMFDSWRTKETLTLTSDGELGRGGGLQMDQGQSWFSPGTAQSDTFCSVLPLPEF